MSHFNTTPVIFVNPAHGNEPYLLGIDIALEISDQLEKRGLTRPSVLVPLLYGQRQRNIIRDEFGERADQVLLDEAAGTILQPILFGKGGYARHLEALVLNYKHSTHQMQERYASATPFSAQTMHGEIVEIHPKQPTKGMIKKEGVYLMFSGTEMDVEDNMALFETVWNSGLEVYVPPLGAAQHE